MFYILFLLTIQSFIFTQISEGYTLFTPFSDGSEINSYLLNTEGETIHTWTHEKAPASMPYLLTDSTIIYPYRVLEPTMVAGGVGGGVKKIDWDGVVIWDYQFSNDTYQHHHDIEPLPNGNILLVVWEKKSSVEAYAMGRQVINNPLNQMWSTAILELNPTTGNIDWEWHLWDHLIQDISNEYPNYGNISQNPQLFDINCGSVGNMAGGPQGANGDWMHINAIDYNNELDQIVISSRTQNEIYIIDHSTTSAEASGHSGGNSGKGGDFLYRWGNPANYNNGTDSDRILHSQHGVNWIPDGYPGYRNLILFNNFHDQGESAVLELSPPLNNNLTYDLNTTGFYGPSSWTWGYFGGDITTPMQGGAFRLSNGNTLITQTHTSRIIEIDFTGRIVWDYIFPTDISIPWIARAQKYPINFLEQYLIPGDINFDGIINILDVVSCVNIVLGISEWTDSADYNSDGIINVLDIVSIVNWIMNE